MKICNVCGLEKPFDGGAKVGSKARGFYKGKCWSCYRVAYNQLLAIRRLNPQVRARHNAANVATNTKRAKVDAWYRLRLQLAKETYNLLKQLAKGRGTDYACQKLFGQDRETCYAQIDAQLVSKGLQWEDYQFSWQLDHRVPLGLAQTDLQLRQLCLLENVQALTHVEHAAKTILDTALVRKKL